MKRSFSIIILSLSAIIGYAQSCPDGNTAYQNKDYALALKEFSACMKDFPLDSSVIFMKGNTLMLLKEYKDAIPYLEESITGNYQPIRNTQFALGLSYAAIGKDKESIERSL